MSWTVDKGPCGCCGEACCAIPTNCDVAVATSFGFYAYNGSTWVSTSSPYDEISVGLGNCEGDFSALEDPKYATCCLWTSVADTPYLGEGLCNEWAIYLYGRIVCDSCCETNRPTAGVNCRIQDDVAIVIVNGERVIGNESTPCDPYIPLVEWSIECSEDGCNPLP